MSILSLAGMPSLLGETPSRSLVYSYLVKDSLLVWEKATWFVGGIEHGGFHNWCSWCPFSCILFLLQHLKPLKAKVNSKQILYATVSYNFFLIVNVVLHFWIVQIIMDFFIVSYKGKLLYSILNQLFSLWYSCSWQCSKI